MARGRHDSESAFRRRSLESLGAVDLDEKGDFRGDYHPWEKLYKHLAKRLALKRNGSLDPRLQDTLEANLRTFDQLYNVAHREVKLKGHWYKRLPGELLLIDQDSKAYILLRTKNARIYLLSEELEEINCSLEELKSLQIQVFQVLPLLPPGRLTKRSLLSFILQHNRSKVLGILAISVLVSALAAIFPFGISALFNWVLPSAERFFLNEVFLLLLCLALVRVLFNYSLRIISYVFEDLNEYYLQSALLHRVLQLPVSFFDEESSGSLSYKIIEFEDLIHFMSAVLFSAVHLTLFSLFNLVVMLSFDFSLSIAIGFFVLVYLAFAFWVLFKLLQEDRVQRLRGLHLNAMVIQFFNGIVKIKQAAAEWNVISFWSHYFARLRNKDYALFKSESRFRLFSSSLPWIGQMILFSWYYFNLGDLALGNFLGFNAATFNLLISLSALGLIGMEAKSTLPRYESLQTALQMATEKEQDGATVEIKGQIEVKQVSFAYPKQEQWVLKDLSFTIEAGSSVALVGPSGSGKSTLLKVLLGFYKIQKGAVYYDDQDLASLNLKDFRKQLGVVLQNDRLFEGSIFENIVGSANLGIEEAWLAAEMASVKEAIEAMPMNMHTMLSGSGSLSGGQEQRILIARALISEPQILFLDESTSALDNIAQKEVMDTLDSMSITRVMIAHRLSTIKHCDKIIYLEDGQKLEEGSFEELMELQGAFYRLAKRQMV